jgi:hypothetical protein
MIVTTAAVLLTAGVRVAPAAPATLPGVVPIVQAVEAPFLVTAASVQQTPAQPGGDVKVDVDLDSDGGVWYTNPLWIVIGVAAVIIIVALVAMASRGGGGSTTVVR